MSHSILGNNMAYLLLPRLFHLAGKHIRATGGHRPAVQHGRDSRLLPQVLEARPHGNVGHFGQIF